MHRSNLKRLGSLGVIAIGISILPIGQAAAGNNKIRWGIPSVNFATTPLLSRPEDIRPRSRMTERVLH